MDFSDEVLRTIPDTSRNIYKAYGMPKICSPTYVGAQVNGINVKVLLDTRAACSLLSECLANHLKLEFQSFPENVPGLCLSTISKTRNTYYANIELKLVDRIFMHEIFVVCNFDRNYVIIGNDFLKQNDI